MNPNAGIDPHRPLTRLTGDITVTTPGTTIDSIDLQGRLIIRAPGFRLRNSRVRGVRNTNPAFPTGPTQYRPLIDCRHPNVRDALIENSHLEPDDPSPYWEAGISGINFVMTGTLITRTVDGVRINSGSNPATRANVHMSHNVIGWLGYFRAATVGIVHPSDTETHNDCVHIEGTDGAEITDNDLYGYWAEGWGDYDSYMPDRAGSDLQVIQVNNRTNDPARNIQLYRNRIHGGRYPVNLGGAAKVDTSHNIITAHRNVFKGDAGIAGQTILLDTTWNGTTGADCGEGTPLANRLYDIGGPEITVRRNG